MKKTIFLHGYLADLHSDPIEVEADTIAEAMRSLEMFPHLKPEGGGYHPVEIDGVETEVQLFGENSIDEIHVRPRMGGSGGRGGVLQVVLGVTMVAVGLAFPGLSLFGTQLAGSLILGGSMMALGGLWQMMNPAPEIDNTEDESSNYIPADKNTVKSGTPIPVPYGVVKLFGHFLHFDVDTTNVSTQDAPDDSGLSGIARDIRMGEDAFSSGKFSYRIYTTNKVETAEAADFYPTGANWELFAQGRDNPIRPDYLMNRATDGRRARGFIAIYETFIPAKGSNRSIPFQAIGPQGAQVFLNDVEVTGTTLDIPAGSARTLQIRYRRTFEYVPMESDKYVFRIDDGSGMRRIQETSLFDDLDNSGISYDEDVKVRKGRYRTYDDPNLADGIGPVLPVFSSPTSSPSNVPISAWVGA